MVRGNFANATTVEVLCNAGETVTGGGAFNDSGLVASYPKYSGDGEPATGWRAQGVSTGLGTYVYVMCASP